MIEKHPDTDQLLTHWCLSSGILPSTHGNNETFSQFCLSNQTLIFCFNVDVLQPSLMAQLNINLPVTTT